MARLYDVTLPIREGMITYPGDPPLHIEPHSRIAHGDDANVTTLTFGSHTGTHVDAARHFLEGGQAVDQLPLDAMVGPATVVDIPHDVTCIGAAELRAAGVAHASRVLLRTRNSKLLERSAFEEDFAHLTADGAAYLAEHGARLVGIDYLSIEAFDADRAPAHRTLLAREVVVIEGLDLRDVPAGDYELICLPLRIAGIDGAPARVVLRSAD